MSSRRALVLFVVVLSLNTAVFGAAPRTNSDPESVRRHIVEILTVLPDLAPGDVVYAEAAKESKARVESLSPSELAPFAKINDVQLERLGRYFAASAARARQRTEARGMKPVAKVFGPQDHPLPTLSYDVLCGATPNDSSAELNTIDGINIATGAAIVADALTSITVVAGEGSNAPTIAAAAALHGTALAIQWALTRQQFCDGYIAFQESHAAFSNLSHVHDDLVNSVKNDDQNTNSIVSNDNLNRDMIFTNDNSNRDKIASNDNGNRDKIVNNDNSNRDKIVNNDNSNKQAIVDNANTNRQTIITEMRTIGCELDRLLNTPDGKKTSSIASCSGQPGFPYQYHLTALPLPPPVTQSVPAPADNRGQDGVAILPMMGTVTMETNLLEGRMIPSYYLPASRGGMLEQVQVLVWNTINAQLELTIVVERTEPARTVALEADQLFVQKRYVEAYRKYAAAYQRLVPSTQQPGELETPRAKDGPGM